MYNSPRAATVRAVNYCTLWTLDRVFFRQAMVTSSSNQNVQLSQFLSKIALFASIGVQKLNQLARSLTKQSYDDGQYIIRQGDIGDQFYVIFRGRVIVSKADDSGNEEFLLELGEGEVFGERALIKKEPRKANIMAKGAVECYFLESHDFYSMLGEFVEKFNKMNEFRVIRSAKIVSKLSDSRLKELISRFTIHRMFAGQRLVCGCNEIFITIDGQFISSHGDKFASDGRQVEIGGMEKTADEVAGALTALSDEGTLGSFTKEQLLDAIKKTEDDEIRTKLRRNSLPGNSDTRASTPSSLLSINRSSSNSIVDVGMIDVEKEILVTTERRRITASARRLSLASFSCSTLNDVSILQPLGQGTFGSVFLVNQIHTNKKMALKCLNKRAIVENGQHLYIRREIIALQNFQHPFIADYFGTILSRNQICFLLEFIPGGELWSYLYDESRREQVGEHGGIPREDVIFYAGTVLLALEHIHGLGYIYRDLKPENLMIHDNGYLKLVDFGFAKQVPFVNKRGAIQYRTFTLCGTPDYMAPELVLTQGHDKSVDYWAFGALIYELLCGHTPFEGSNQERIFEKIVHSQRHLAFPHDFNPHGKSLIRRLLHPNAALRIGALQNGIDDIKQHAFFAMQSLDFDGLLRQELQMPFIPPAFAPGSRRHHSLRAKDLDLELELSVGEDEFSEYFADLSNPDLME
jgi:serine/threonine protein kinase/CRP-like cAMP-binding protein